MSDKELQEIIAKEYCLDLIIDEEEKEENYIKELAQEYGF